MPFQKGRSGNPGGRPRGGNTWRDELRKALLQYESDVVKRGQALRRIAVKVVELALEGDKDAWQEIGNRLDGKPAQAVDVSMEVHSHETWLERLEQMEAELEQPSEPTVN